MKGIAIDVRHLCNVLCNSAEKYYKNRNKEEFCNHKCKIVDVEQESNVWSECERKANSIMDRKKVRFSYDELTDEAKSLLEEIRQGKVKPMILDKLCDETDLKFTVALLELLYSGMLGESKNLIDLITAKKI